MIKWLQKRRERKELEDLMHDLAWKVFSICERYDIESEVGHEFDGGLNIVCVTPLDAKPEQERCAVYYKDNLACRVEVNHACIIRRLNRPYMRLEECHKSLPWLRLVGQLYQGILDEKIEEARKKFCPWEEAYK